MKIGLFSDTHYCDVETLEQNRKPKRAYDCVKTAYEDFKNHGVDIVICLGDLIHFNDGISVSCEYLKKISSLINSFCIPTYICLGNHDSEVLSAEDFSNISNIKTAPCVLSFENTKLILLDAGYTPDGKPFQREHVDWTKSFVPQSQLEWLDNELDCDKKCIVFIHQNIDKNVEEHHIVSNADEINRIIQSHSNVARVYQGHYHYGAENTINGILYTTIRAMCIGDENNFKIIEV